MRYRWASRLVAILLALGCLLVSAPPARAGGTAVYEAAAVSHGIRLSISLPRRPYPRYALVSVAVTLQNVSHRTYWEDKLVGTFCAEDYVSVDAEGSSGPALSLVPPALDSGSCAPSTPYPFPPGRTIHEREHVVFNVLDDGSTDVALAAETIRYPAPPPRARIHGPFTQLRLALQVYGGQGSTTQVNTIHTVITSRHTISRVVSAIDAITAAYRVRALCFGRGGGRLGTNHGPVWLTFVRPNGSKIHAFESGPGLCGGLAVNGFRWLLDPGAVWSLVLPLAQRKGVMIVQRFPPNQGPTGIEARRREADARHERERSEAAQHHELKPAHQAERGERGSWWQRVVRVLRRR